MRKFLAVMVLFTLAFASYGCGDSGGSEVYTTNNGATGGGTGNVPARVADVDVRVQVGQAFPGAQQVAALEVDRATAMLRLFSSPAYAQTTSFTLPGATVAAFGSTGSAAAGTSTVDARGIAHFDDLPFGTYRFVVSNGGRVVLITVATAGEGLTVTASDVTTAASLVAIRRGAGVVNQEAFDNILQEGPSVAEFNALLVQIRAAQTGTAPFVSDNGLAIQSTSLANTVLAANEAVPETPTPPPSGSGGGGGSGGGASSSGGNTTSTGTSSSTGTTSSTGTSTGTGGTSSSTSSSTGTTSSSTGTSTTGSSTP